MRDTVAVLEEVVHLRNFERVSYTLIHARKDQSVSFLLMPDISSNQGPNPRRVDVRHAEDESPGAFPALERIRF